jgi:hypothetical protein
MSAMYSEVASGSNLISAAKTVSCALAVIFDRVLGYSEVALGKPLAYDF